MQPNLLGLYKISQALENIFIIPNSYSELKLIQICL